ncbi:MAG: hypothetical protein CMA92_00585 [Euryarchaeota archaeon]|nr:hypothetical protein [Euryarchaeota archaeon]
MGSLDGYLQALSLVAILILAPMTIHLVIHKDENTVFVYVDSSDDSEDKDSDRLDNETIAREIPELNRSEVARIATFNIKVFGETKMGKPEVVSVLVDTVLQYDMVSVQEIRDIDQTVPYDFLEQINNRSNNTWDMLLSERSGQQEDDTSYQEQYAFYYNTTVFSPINGSLYNDSEFDLFQKEPYIGSFEMLNESGNNSGFNFTLINIHTKPAIAMEEINALHTVVQDYQQQNPNEPDIVVLGDYNADCSYASSEELWQSPMRNSNYTWLVPDSADTTVASSECAYDRIVTTGDLSGRLVGSWGIDYTSFNSSNVSDHYPVWFDLYR